ncbi:F-box/kelch-repeat protein At3g23880-like [Salvia miltiorrhiza]|uniref:F-box/kelch-repeat protein At3g23880-like n=1 Tax=Salvia miltiorrhiza TaxID=226208 RepID=UPI0025ABC278|nr:F-box/kelch-repeat protein At3g23880-like [Salvia miltiorrhiza]
METRNTRRSLHLPEEIIEEILSRLAVKSVLRLRCVLKSWRSLIDSERFIKTHLQNSLKDTAFSHHRLIPYYSLTLSGYRELFYIVGCCNGLVCCIIHELGRFFLWNPATRISKELPKIENVDRLLSTYGFGWDESTGVYKVFVLFYPSSRGSKRMGKVYSSNTNSWKTVERCDFLRVHGKGHFVNGKLHWLREEKNVREIVTFDLKKEEFGLMKLPYESISVRLGVNEGRLITTCENKDEFDIWVMEQDSSWVKVKATDVVVYEPSSECILLQDLLCTSHENSILIFGRAYKVLRGSTLKLYDRVYHKKGEAYSPPHLYVQTLVSPVLLSSS